MSVVLVLFAVVVRSLLSTIDTTCLNNCFTGF